jgi:hypothetical protein
LGDGAFRDSTILFLSLSVMTRRDRDRIGAAQGATFIVDLRVRINFVELNEGHGGDGAAR